MIDLNQTCRNCGRAVREHCQVSECRYFLRWCDAYFVKQTDDWPAGSYVGGTCLKCRKPVASHYRFEPFGGLTVMGVEITPRGRINYLWPCWTGCPAEWPMPSDSFHC